MQLTCEQCERLEREARQARRKRANAGNGPWRPKTGQRALEPTRIAVARIDGNPALAQTGLDNIERRARQDGGHLPRAHAEWQTLIRRYPWPELRESLLEESGQGQRLRSSHPCTGLVTPEKRARVRANDP